MKKKSFMGIMLLIAAMVLSAGGTCFAQDTAPIVDSFNTGASPFFGPVFSTAEEDTIRSISSGASAYGICGSLILEPKTKPGATPFAIANTITDTNGDLNISFPTDATDVYWSGATPVGSPAVISGETNAFVVVVQAPYGTEVEDGFNTGTNNGQSGLTVAMIDGATMAVSWDFGIPEYVATTGGGGDGGPRYYNAESSVSPWFPTQLTVWTPSTRLDATGATIYGTSGVSPNNRAGPFNAAAVTGASVWALTNVGALITNGTTSWPLDTTQYSGIGGANLLVKGTTSVSAISGFVAAPVISGESVFYVGYSQAISAATLYQLDKDDLGGFTNGAQNTTGGVIYSAPMRTGVDNSDRYMPTPVASGGSLFVVCNRGGVTVYDTQDLAFGGTRTAGYVGEVALFRGTTTGVTASPVVYETGQDDPYIIVAGTSAITAFKISDGLSSVSRQWWYDYAANDAATVQIWGTPAVSNGYLLVPVVNGNSGWIDVFNITGRADRANDQQNRVARNTLNSPVYASSIIAGTNLWAFSYGAAGNVATAYKFDEDARASGNDYWTQFKFDAAKSGENTVVAAAAAAAVPGSSGGCFISTIK